MYDRSVLLILKKALLKPYLVTDFCNKRRILYDRSWNDSSDLAAIKFESGETVAMQPLPFPLEAVKTFMPAYS